MFFFFFILPFIFGAMLASMTSMIEHYEMALTEDDAYSSRTYGTSCHLTNFIWNNVTYHNEHHKYPGIPGTTCGASTRRPIPTTTRR